MKSNRICKEICKKFRVTKPTGQGRYDAGHGRCQTCDVWIDYHGAHAQNGEAATADSKGWFCNCCNFRIRRNPRSKKYKEKLRSANATYKENSNAKSGNKVDLPDFNKQRTHMIKCIVECIPQNKNDFQQHEFEKLLTQYGMSIAKIESGFNESIEKILDLAYTLNPPNKISMIVEFERICVSINAIPTQRMFEKHSQLKVSQYKNEFGTWKNLLEKLGYGLHKNKKNNALKNTNIVRPLSDKTDSKYLQNSPAQTDIDVLNWRIGEALRLMKSNPDGIYLSDVRRLLEIPQESMPSIITRLVRIEGVSKKNIVYKEVLQDVLFSYKVNEIEGKESKDEINEHRSTDDTKQESKPYKDTQESILKKSSTDKMVQDIGTLAQQMVNEHIANKTEIQKHLRQRLTKEFVELGSMSKVIKNNSEVTKDAIKQHVRTSMRLPLELKRLENEGNLHPNPDCSLQIALFAVNYYEWDDKKKNEKNVIQLAQSLSMYVNKNNNLNQIFSGKIKLNNNSNNPRSKNNENSVSAVTAVWVAAATLHKLYGIRRDFSNKVIFEKMIEHDISTASEQSFALCISRHCVANNSGKPSDHRKLYRVSRGRYRLYRKGDYYNQSRKHSTEEPDIEELPDKYKHLIKWYYEEYCKKK